MLNLHVRVLQGMFTRDYTLLSISESSLEDRTFSV